MKYLKFTLLSQLIIPGIQRNSLIVIKSLRADNHPAANEVILEIHIDSLKEHRAHTNFPVTIPTTKMNAEIRVTIKQRKQH